MQKMATKLVSFWGLYPQIPTRGSATIPRWGTYIPKLPGLSPNRHPWVRLYYLKRITRTCCTAEQESVSSTFLPQHNRSRCEFIGEFPAA